MKKMAYTVGLTGKTAKLIKDIVRTEDLDVRIEYAENILGDPIIKIEGDTEEVLVLKSVFEMVAGTMRIHY